MTSGRAERGQKSSHANPLTGTTAPSFEPRARAQRAGRYRPRGSGSLGRGVFVTTYRQLGNLFPMGLGHWFHNCSGSVSPGTGCCIEDSCCRRRRRLSSPSPFVVAVAVAVGMVGWTDAPDGRRPRPRSRQILSLHKMTFPPLPLPVSPPPPRARCDFWSLAFCERPPPSSERAESRA